MISAPNVNVYRPAPTPLLDTNNSIRIPESSDLDLSLGEGIYVLRDQVQLGAVPPPPSDTTPAITNSLDTKPKPPSAGARLSLIPLTPQKPPVSLRNHLTLSHDKSPKAHHPGDSPHPSPQTSEPRANAFSNLTSGNFRAFGFGSASQNASQPAVKEVRDAQKRKKPKNNINKTGSAFVARAVPGDGVSKRLQDRKSEGLVAFVNHDRSFQWMDLASSNKADQLMKIIFSKAHALCHDVNTTTKTPLHLDVILGFSTSDIMWYEPFSQKYTRINKNGLINATAISNIRWVPGSESLFLATHHDGSIIIYDKDREDASFTADETADLDSNETPSGKKHPRIRTLKSRDAKNQKANPVAYYKVSRRRINDCSFSPEGNHVAVVSEEGSLRIIDLTRERLNDVYSSYYGGINCVCWSPDGRYILTGGQDDLVSVWSFEERQLIARGLGHKSWVTALAFDPWRCDDLNYRFASVGEDRRLLFWEFTSGMLNRPRTASIRPSISSSLVPSLTDQPLYQRDGESSSSEDASNKTIVEEQHEVHHEVAPRAEVAMLPPVAAKVLDEQHHALSWVGFHKKCVIVTCKGGHVFTWERPEEEQEEDDDAITPVAGPTEYFRS